MADILVLDSEIQICSILSDILAGRKYRVFSTPSGRRALYILKKRKISLIISSLSLLDIGYEGFVAELGRLPDVPKMIRIKKSKSEAFEKMSDTVSFPIDNETLFELIERNMEKEMLAKPRDFRRFLLYIMFSLIVAVAFYFITPPKKDVIVNIPSVNVSGISIDEQNVYLLDWFEKKLYLLDKKKLFSVKKAPDGDPGAAPEIRKISISGTSPVGLSVQGRYFWTTDLEKKAFLKYDMASPAKSVETVPAPGPSPSGLFDDGLFLWSSDTVYKKVYRHNYDERLSVVDVISPDVKYLSGMFMLKGKLYVADGDNNLFVVYDKNMNPVYKLKLKYYESGERLGVAGTDGRYIYSIPEGRDRIIVHYESGMTRLDLTEKK